MLKPIVEFCASNMHHGTDRIMKRLEEQSDAYEVIEYGCLGNCGECYLFPFALVDGEIVTAETVDQLYDEIVRITDAQRAHREAMDKLLDDM